MRDETPNVSPFRPIVTAASISVAAVFRRGARGAAAVSASAASRRGMLRIDGDNCFGFRHADTLSVADASLRRLRSRSNGLSRGVSSVCLSLSLCLSVSHCDCVRLRLSVSSSVIMCALSPLPLLLIFLRRTVAALALSSGATVVSLWFTQPFVTKSAWNIVPVQFMAFSALAFDGWLLLHFKWLGSAFPDEVLVRCCPPLQLAPPLTWRRSCSSVS